MPLDRLHGQRATGAATLDFLSGGGEMGALMRAHDWSASSLGPPAGWPQPLRTVVRIMLNTGHPMYIWWGPELACLYNDAYRQSIGPERHPGSLGKPAREVWEEIWDIIGPQIEQVRSGGGATWHEDQLVPITRHGRREDVYWTYSYSPIDDENAPNAIGGVLVVCTETTQKILAERRQAAAKEQQRRQFEQAPGFIIVMRGVEHTVEFVNNAHRRLFGSDEWIGRTIRDAFPSIAGQGFYELLDGGCSPAKRSPSHSDRSIPRRHPVGPRPRISGGHSEGRRYRQGEARLAAAAAEPAGRDAAALSMEDLAKRGAPIGTSGTEGQQRP